MPIRTPNKDKLFYGEDKESHYCFDYLIQIPDHHVCDNYKLNYNY